jgi:hypothetical protein
MAINSPHFGPDNSPAGRQAATSRTWDVPSGCPASGSTGPTVVPPPNPALRLPATPRTGPDGTGGPSCQLLDLERDLVPVLGDEVFQRASPHRHDPGVIRHRPQQSHHKVQRVLTAPIYELPSRLPVALHFGRFSQAPELSLLSGAVHQPLGLPPTASQPVEILARLPTHCGSQGIQPSPQRGTVNRVREARRRTCRTSVSASPPLRRHPSWDIPSAPPSPTDEAPSRDHPLCGALSCADALSDATVERPTLPAPLSSHNCGQQFENIIFIVVNPQHVIHLATPQATRSIIERGRK